MPQLPVHALTKGRGESSPRQGYQKAVTNSVARLAGRVEWSKINIGLIKIANKYNKNYIDLYSSFLSKNNELNDAYSLDGLHLNGKGYQLWKQIIKKDIE